MLEVALKLKLHLEQNKAVKSFDLKDSAEFIALDRDLRFLSNKPVIYGANIDESGESPHLKAVQDYAKSQNSTQGNKVVTICAKLEEEMIEMSDDEKAEFLSELGLKQSGLEQMIRISFETLNLISYFTAGVKEVRAWTITQGTKAPQAAAVIYNDFEKGFIRAETISFADFVKYGGESGAKENGAMRSEGKDYVVQDGDIMHFRFNV